jgi:lysophospholipase L1-like esterase
MLVTLLSEPRKVDVVCLGDSITGWNNFGDVSTWPFSTYPTHLVERLSPENSVSVLNAGIAGDISINAEKMVKYCLERFSEAKYYVVGYGTNDLAQDNDVCVVSKQIVDSLERAINVLVRAEKKVVLFNVPYLNSTRLSTEEVRVTNSLRDYHNQKLVERFSSRTEMVDICSYLKPEHFGDVLHPNESGAKLIASLVYAALERVQQVGQATTLAGL